MLVRLRFWIILALNVFLVCVSLVSAWLLRFEFTLPQRRILLTALPILLVMRLTALARFNLLHGYWRYTGLSDVTDILKATVLSTAAFLLVERFLLGIVAFPKSIYLLEALLAVGSLCGIRLVSRTLLQAAADNSRSTPKKKVIVVGAGDAAERLLKDLPNSGYLAVALVDDDRQKFGARIHGAPVMGTIDDLPRLVKVDDIAEILIAIPSATGAEMRRIARVCEPLPVRFRTIPALADLINGKVTVEQLRDVDIEDLLGREPVCLDLEPVRQQLTDKVVMVTGAAGSIGSELCRQLLYYEPRKLLCVDQDESGLFFLDQRLSQECPTGTLEYRVADIADSHCMRRLISGAEVDIIFHAAAYKHVPMMEANVSEAIRNNVFALTSLLDVAEQAGCGSFLMISSDKAVNPTNVMGCTKRLGELIMAAKPGSRMRRVSVRFGNVLGSQGSVIPVLQEQIRTQQKVTVTHPDITRFFMTIPEAVSLVLQAFTVGKDGEILVLEMGRPVRILELAQTLIRLCGKKEDDIEIEFIGLRPGEKLHEELFYESEVGLRTECEKVMRTAGSIMAWSVLQQHLRELDDIVYSAPDSAIRSKLAQIIPEYKYAEQPADPARQLPALIHNPGLQIAATASAND